LYFKEVVKLLLQKRKASLIFFQGQKFFLKDKKDKKDKSFFPRTKDKKDKKDSKDKKDKWFLQWTKYN